MSNITHVFIVVVVMMLFVSAGAGFFLNRQRGLGKDREPWLNKKLIYFFFTLLNMVTASFVMWHQDNFAWPYIILTTLLLYGSYFLGFSPSWGECFPWLKPTYDEKFAPLVRQSANILTGYEYNKGTPDPKVIKWKIAAMSSRFGIYFSVKYIVLAVSLSSPVPLFGVPLIFLCGKIYGYIFQDNKGEEDVAVSEQLTGIYMMVVDSLLIAASFFLYFKL